MGRRPENLRGLAAAFAGAIVLSLLILGATAVVDAFASSAYQAEVRARVANNTDTLARNLSDLVARETAAVDALVAFVENRTGDTDHLDEEFPLFAAALMELGQTIRSVQVAPGAILEYVYPIEGNEAALGLDLMADADRRRVLEPTIETGATVLQGPVELVQGGVGLIVRRPIYLDDEYWGFSAVVLDWPEVARLSGLTSPGHVDVAGVKLADTGEVIAGSAEAFNGDPIMRELAVGGTDTVWMLAQRPVGGWPETSTDTPFIWGAGALLAVMSGYFSFSLIRRPATLRRERERVIGELAALEARYQATFENAGVGIAVTDRRGAHLSVNPKFREIVGLGEDEALDDLDVLSLMSERDRARYVDGLRGLLEGDEVFEVEVRLQSCEVDRWCRVRTSLVPGAHSQEPLFVAIVEDSTERRLAEQALAASEMRYRQLFELAPIAIQREDHTAVADEVRRVRRSGVTDIREYARNNPDWLRELLGRVPILDVNPAGADLQGRGVDSESLTLLDRYTETAHATFIESIAAIDEGRVRITQEVEALKPDGSPLHMDLRWQAPIVDGKPDYANVMVTLADITELRQTSRRLRDLIESKDRFLASVAHELRTPLTAVVGFAEELRDPGGIYSTREKAEFQELIAFHGAEMASIIEDLLVWARGDIGEVHVTTEPIDLIQGVTKTLKLLPRVDIPITSEAEQVLAVGDATRVRQIVRNLATNAIRYGGEDVEVVIREDDETAIVEVCDDGPEIPVRTREQMFEPYARTHSISSQPDSIGLGLTVARTLARLQGGDLVCVREGSRNVFRLTLPLDVAKDDVVATGAFAGAAS